MPIRLGTSHFVSFKAACRYYKPYGCEDADVQRKLDDGEIHIGPPDIGEGETTILIDEYTRYAIVEKA